VSRLRKKRPAARARRVFPLGLGLIAAGTTLAILSWLAFKEKQRETKITGSTNPPAVSVVAGKEPAADPFFAWLSNSTDGVELLNMGTTLLEEGRPTQAIFCYRRALELKPDDEEANFNLGVAHSRLGQLAEAERAYRASLEIFPEYSEARNNLGNVLTRQKRYTEAAAEFAEVLKVEPDNASAHNNLGRALAEQGDMEKATNHFIRAVQLDTNYFEARFNLGSACLALRQTNQAIEAFQEARLLRPDFAPVIQALERLKAQPR
jgi:Flp pilus assembly protein TadD